MRLVRTRQARRIYHLVPSGDVALCGATEKSLQVKDASGRVVPAVWENPEDANRGGRVCLECMAAWSTGGLASQSLEDVIDAAAEYLCLGWAVGEVARRHGWAKDMVLPYVFALHTLAGMEIMTQDFQTAKMDNVPNCPGLPMGYCGDCRAVPPCPSFACQECVASSVFHCPCVADLCDKPGGLHWQYAFASYYQDFVGECLWQTRKRDPSRFLVLEVDDDESEEWLALDSDAENAEEPTDEELAALQTEMEAKGVA